MNIPLFLTYLRIVLIPAIVVIFYLPGPHSHLIASACFFVACFTDWLDGYLARTLNQTTKLGAFLDPVADKLAVASVLVLIVAEFSSIYVTIPAIIIIGREIAVSALREWMAEMGKRTSIAVSWIGKFKTAIQMWALILLLLYYPAYHLSILIIGMVLLYVAAVLTLWSMLIYLKTAWPDLTERDKK